MPKFDFVAARESRGLDRVVVQVDEADYTEHKSDRCDGEPILTRAPSRDHTTIGLYVSIRAV